MGVSVLGFLVVIQAASPRGRLRHGLELRWNQRGYTYRSGISYHFLIDSDSIVRVDSSTINS